MSKLKEMITVEEFDYICQLYKNGVSLRKISILTKHNRASITKMLEEEQIKTIKGNHYRYYTFDYDYFEQIDNANKAYWLGFLYADGCIIEHAKYGEPEFKLALGKIDEEILLYYKHDLKSTYPIRYDYSKHRKNDKHQIQVICSYRSAKTVSDLIDKGCIPRKSLILDFPNEKQVPKQFIYHFIRGYFDGDGSISKQNNTGSFSICITGTENFIKQLYKYFNFGIIYKDKRKVNSWYLRINKKQYVKIFYEKVYKDAERFLKRKYDKFQEFLEINKYSES